MGKYSAPFYEYSNALILRIADNKSLNRIQKAFLMALSLPYIVIKGLACLVYDYTIGKCIMYKRISNENKKSYKHDLGFVAIVKNEGDYIREWIAYHYLRCGENTIFYIYDNESEDGLKDRIQDFIDKGIVVYTFFPGLQKQLDAYDDAISKYKNEVRYMAFIDIDEFLYSKRKDSLQATIQNLIQSNPNAAGLAVNWAIYGSSGQIHKTEGLVTERFLKRAPKDFWGNEHIKTIANPRLVKNFISCHYPLYKPGCWNINTMGKRQRLWLNSGIDNDIVRLNHYFGKSRDEFIAKKSRGRAASGGFYPDFSRFDEYDRNDEYDAGMLEYSDDIKKMTCVNI